MITKGCLEFPDGTPELTATLAAYSAAIAMQRPPNERADLMLEAMALLWPERVFKISSWTRRRVKTFCSEPFFTMWGPSSAGKSTDVAAIVLVHWLAAPHITTCTVCSTTRPALVQRIFGEVVRLYLTLEENAPGSYQSSKTQITLGDENSKNGIFGVAVLIGTLKDAMGNMIGKHNRRNVLVVDEMQVTRAAAVEAVSNLQAGEDFHFVGIGNPESRLDPLGRYSEPVDGWESITPESDEWKTKFGKCIFFDGRKSPAIVEPDGAKRYPYLINQAGIDLRAKWYGENSPLFWSQAIGFIPPEGLQRTLFSETFFIKHRMTEAVIWGDSYQVIASLDPSFASGGDRCVLGFARIGYDREGRWVMEFEEPVMIPMVMQENEPMSYGTARKVKEACMSHGVEPTGFAMDITGTQSALADIIEAEWGPGIMRIQFGGKPSDLPISIEDPTPANQRYANRVTELWHTFYQFGRQGHIRGVGVDAIKEFCSRLLLEKVLPVCIEPKLSMRGRTGSSPDIADMMVVGTALVRERLGITPGYGMPQGNTTANDVKNIDYNLDNPERVYLNTPEETYVGIQ